MRPSEREDTEIQEVVVLLERGDHLPAELQMVVWFLDEPHPPSRAFGRVVALAGLAREVESRCPEPATFLRITWEITASSVEREHMTAARRATGLGGALGASRIV